MRRCASGCAWQLARPAASAPAGDQVENLSRRCGIVRRSEHLRQHPKGYHSGAADAARRDCGGRWGPPCRRGFGSRSRVPRSLGWIAFVGAGLVAPNICSCAVARHLRRRGVLRCFRRPPVSRTRARGWRLGLLFLALTTITVFAAATSAPAAGTGRRSRGYGRKAVYRRVAAPARHRADPNAAGSRRCRSCGSCRSTTRDAGFWYRHWSAVFSGELFTMGWAVATSLRTPGVEPAQRRHECRPTCLGLGLVGIAVAAIINRRKEAVAEAAAGRRPQ